MDIITGYTGSPHVTAEQDRDVNIGIFGAESYVLRTGSRLKAEVSSNNEIKVRDGVIMHQGCAASIKKNTYDSLTIAFGEREHDSVVDGYLEILEQPRISTPYESVNQEFPCAVLSVQRG